MKAAAKFLREEGLVGVFRVGALRAKQGLSIKRFRDELLADTLVNSVSIHVYFFRFVLVPGIIGFGDDDDGDLIWAPLLSPETVHR